MAHRTETQISALGRDWYVDIEYRTEGRYFPATRIDPAEYPEVVVERVFLSGVAPAGTEIEQFFRDIEVNFELLPAEAQDAITVACYAEVRAQVAA